MAAVERACLIGARACAGAAEAYRATGLMDTYRDQIERCCCCQEVCLTTASVLRRYYSGGDAQSLVLLLRACASMCAELGRPGPRDDLCGADARACAAACERLVRAFGFPV